MYHWNRELETIYCDLKAGSITREAADQMRNSIWRLANGRDISSRVWDKLDKLVRGVTNDR